MKTLRIDVSGRTGSGKSTVASIIKAQFDALGLECEIVESEFDTAVSQEEWIERMKAIQGHKLKIYTVHVDDNPEEEILPPDEKTD